MDDHYLVEIEFLAKEKKIVKALSKEWAEIIARENWEKEREELISNISTKLHK